ncbi:MAG: hypothetical protein HY891_02730 [Deltaproteobacteria bacterium]|nr:hypothetical protein [Deltaproteobacteria bacterium]
MKRYLAIALAASLGMLSTVPAFAAVDPTSTSAQSTGVSGSVSDYTVGTAANGIGNSRHNLGGYGEHIVTNNTTEICVFCHTPHHTNTSSSGSKAPLWNRASMTTVYTAYTNTIGGNSSSSAAVVGSSSAACLSCHDGVTTFDNLVNAPGKGGLNAAGQDRGWSFTDGGAAVGDTITSSRLKIGTDLSNDHPMSIAYTTNVASLRPTSTVISGINLTAGLSGTATASDAISQNRWAIKGYISDTATIADLLRGGNVECASCHDPHFNNKSWDEVDQTYQNSGGTRTAAEVELESNGLFLRRVGGNSGSGVCRTCHNK